MFDGRIQGWPARTGARVFGHACPECGDRMNEVERVSENGFLFVWYECGRTGCSGQWLEKRLAGAETVGLSAARPAHVVSVG